LRITLKLGEPLARTVGARTITLELPRAVLLSDVFAETNRLYPAFDSALKHGDDDVPYTVFVNEKLVRWEHVAQTQVNDGDKVFVMMPVSGGRG
jgi:molybdopterin converting factor small subunit